MGRPANHRWKHRTDHVTVDFLIATTGSPPTEAKVKVFTDNLSAVLASGLPLAFRDKKRVRLSGKTLRVATALRPLLDSGPAQQAIDILKDDFSSPKHAGPARAAEFLSRSHDDEYKADRAGAVVELLRALGL